MTSQTHRGGCLCGAITYRVTGQLRPVVACHCIQCRKTSGHHVAATSAPRDNVEIEGPIRWYQSSPDARRGFCPTCGSQLFWDGPGENISIFAGGLDGETGLETVGHIFTAWKGDYYALDPDLPQYPEDDPAMTTMVTP